MYGWGGPPPWQQTPFYIPMPQQPTSRDDAVRFLKAELKRLRKGGDKKPDDKKDDKKNAFTFIEHTVFWMAALPFLGLLQVWVFCEVVAHVYDRLHPVFK